MLIELLFSDNRFNFNSKNYEIKMDLIKCIGQARESAVIIARHLVRNKNRGFPSWQHGKRNQPIQIRVSHNRSEVLRSIVIFIMNNHQCKFRREQMSFFRSSDRLDQALTRPAKIGSEIFCESPCESGLASG